MRTRKYKNGKATFKSYLKKVGSGWEVGFVTGTKPLFVGNFINKGDATRFYAHMNREVRKFGKKFKVGPTYPRTWFNQFICHHLYTNYYKYCNRVILPQTRKFSAALKRDVRKYKQLKRRWPAPPKTPFLKAA